LTRSDPEKCRPELVSIRRRSADSTPRSEQFNG
jgi:hypothetical protein